MTKKILTFFLLFINVFFAKAQETVAKPEMAEMMRSNGKIYVVVAVIAIIFIGLIVFLITIDRKVKKLEKQMEETK